MAKKQKIEESSIDRIDELLKDKTFKGRHFGAVSGEEIKNPKTVTTGSIFLDYQLSQNLPGERGLRVGSISRVSGPFQSGKTSLVLTCAANFQKVMPNPMVIAANAEARMTLAQIKGCGVDVSKEKFRLLNANNGDMICDFFEKLVSENPEGYNFFFIIDSSDAITREVDAQKGHSEGFKIAGGAALFSTFCKRLALPIFTSDCALFITSQQRANMAPSPMGMGAGPRKTTSGGEALKFYPSLIAEIKAPWGQQFILSDPSNPKSKVIGHEVHLNLEKSYDGSKKGHVAYPIKYNHGIWKEREILMLCQAWSLLKIEGRTYTFVDSFRDDVKKQGFTLPDKIVGQKEVNNFFDSNPDFIIIAENIFEKLLFSEDRIGLGLTLDNLEESEELV